MMRRFCLVANWKMAGSRGAVMAYVCQLATVLQDCPHLTVVICPPALYLPEMAELTQGTALQLGAQNSYCESSGPFTGEISPTMLQEYGCRYILVGHSERRLIFKEEDALIAKKVAAICEAGLSPIVCLGETNEQREKGETFAVIKQQLEAALSRVPLEAIPKICFAYDPVWAIGTGRVASPALIREAHAYLREKLDGYGLDVGRCARLFYGGSINQENAAALFSEPQVDGGLVGRASLSPEEFIALCRCAESVLDKREKKCNQSC